MVVAAIVETEPAGRDCSHERLETLYSQVASVSLLTPSHQTADLCRPGLMSCLTLLPAFAYRVLGEGREGLNSENRMNHAFM